MSGFVLLVNIETIGFILSVVGMGLWDYLYLDDEINRLGLSDKEKTEFIRREIRGTVIVSLFWWAFWPYVLYSHWRWR